MRGGDRLEALTHRRRSTGRPETPPAAAAVARFERFAQVVESPGGCRVRQRDVRGAARARPLAAPRRRLRRFPLANAFDEPMKRREGERPPAIASVAAARPGRPAGPPSAAAVNRSTVETAVCDRPGPAPTRARIAGLGSSPSASRAASSVDGLRSASACDGASRTGSGARGSSASAGQPIEDRGAARPRRNDPRHGDRRRRDAGVVVGRGA